MAKKLNSHSNFIKNGVYVYERATYEKLGTPPKKEIVPVIKWHQVDMSFEDKQRFNLLTYQDIIQHQMEEMQAAQAAAQPTQETSADTSMDKTFWASDSAERTNLSADEYSDFLAKNGLDVTNRTAVDINSIVEEAAEPETPVTPYEPTEDEILANVYHDIHGDTMLTPEEIAALFAAAEADNK